MNPILHEKLLAIGLDPQVEASVALAGQTRDDGWQAAATGRREVSARRTMFADLRARGLFPTSIVDAAILDVGAGIGPTGMALADEARLVVGIDLFRAHCLSAVECVVDQGWDNVAMYQGSFLAADRTPTVPFRARTFDLIISHHGLSRADILPVLADIRAALVPGGLAYLFLPKWWLGDDEPGSAGAALRSVAMDKHPDWPGLTVASLLERAAELGLETAHAGSAPDYLVLGDMFYMSDLFHSPAEMREHPIPNVVPGQSTVSSLLFTFRRRNQD
jgi:SAM-dependent methyltransferase